jgi:hypothetical protein
LALLVLLLQVVAPTMVLARMATLGGMAGPNGICLTIAPDDGDDGPAAVPHEACPICALRIDTAALPVVSAAPCPEAAPYAAKELAAYTQAQPRAPPRETAQPRAPPSLS